MSNFTYWASKVNFSQNLAWKIKTFLYMCMIFAKRLSFYLPDLVLCHTEPIAFVTKISNVKKLMWMMKTYDEKKYIKNS